MHQFAILIMLAAAADDIEPAGQNDGLDLLVLFGSIGLFLAIVITITILRRWR